MRLQNRKKIIKMSRNVDEIFLYLFDFWKKCLDACHSGIFFAVRAEIPIDF